MAVLLKILFLFCLLSASLSLRLGPPLTVRSPVDLDVLVGGDNKNTQNNVPNKIYSQLQQCFCIPTTSNSEPVNHHLNSPSENIERLVVFIYKVNGALHIYIPNKKKQELIPELNFDGTDGDILSPVSTESIVDIMDSDPIRLQESLVPITQAIVQVPDSPHVIDNGQPNINPGSEEQSQEDHEHHTIIYEPAPEQPIGQPSGQPIGQLSGEPIGQPIGQPIDQPLWQPIGQPSGQPSGQPLLQPSSEQPSSPDNTEDNSSHEGAIILDNGIRPSSIEIQAEPVHIPDHSSQVSSELPNQSAEILISHPDAHASSDHGSGIIPDSGNFDQQEAIASLIALQPSGDQDKDKITNLDDQIIQIPSPDDSQLQSVPILPPNQYSQDLSINPYITFYDWFDLQLKRVILYNLESQAKIIALRKRIQKILLDNGMKISNKGIVTDSNRELVRMNTIKLRPILIGSQIDAQSLLDPSKLSEVSYIQLIEVILVSPPKLLGTLVMGTVYLPRNIHGDENVDFLHSYRKANFLGANGRQGCTRCKGNNASFRKSIFRSSAPKLEEPNPDDLPSYGPYYALPFRRKILKNTVPFEGRKVVNVEPKRRISDVVVKGRNGILSGLLENLSPILISSPSRRLLGGRISNSARPRQHTYPNDVLPGFRIVGGNAATSSGPPLVSKGRSGFEGTSYII